MASNITKRNIYGTLAIVGALFLIAIIVFEQMHGTAVNKWLFYFAFCFLFCSIMLYRKFRTAAKNDQKR